jgi:hypothetical protein
LRDILNSPAFGSATQQSWFGELLSRLLDFWSELFQDTARGVLSLRDLAVLLGLIVVVAVLFYLARNLRRNVVSAEHLLTEGNGPQPESSAAALNSARGFVQQGDYRSAIRQLYLATLLILDERGKLRYDPTLTNREYLHQSQTDPRTVAALAPIVETFDRTWYGMQPVSRAEFDVFNRQLETVQDL